LSANRLTVSKMEEAEEWRSSMEMVVERTDDPEHAKKRLELLNWLIERAEKADRYEKALKALKDELGRSN
jgi:hypothetical protein